MTHSTVAPSALTTLTATALTTRIGQLLSEERVRLIDLLWHLAEMDRRGLALELGYPSLFAYCTDALRLSRAAAWRRTACARLLSQYPIAAEYLGDGRLCLSTFVLLKDVLEPTSHRQLLDRAAGRTEEEVRVLVATLRPRAEVPTSLRRLPSRNTREEVAEPEASSPSAGGSPRPESPRALGSVDLSRDPPPPDAAPLVAGLPTAERRPRLEPIDAERHSLRMTVGAEFMQELAEVKSALSHLVPNGDLEAVLRVCFQKTLESVARRKHAARASSGPELELEVEDCPDLVRTIPAAVRRAVWKRDGGRCSFVGAGGKRCESTWQLEFDHEEPFARGGRPTVDNLSIRCRAHNQHRARQHFGEAHMSKYARPPPWPMRHPPALDD